MRKTDPRAKIRANPSIQPIPNKPVRWTNSKQAHQIDQFQTNPSDRSIPNKHVRSTHSNLQPHLLEGMEFHRSSLRLTGPFLRLLGSSSLPGFSTFTSHIPLSLLSSARVHPCVARLQCGGATNAGRHGVSLPSGTPPTHTRSPAPYTLYLTPQGLNLQQKLASSDSPAAGLRMPEDHASEGLRKLARD